jgi:hypothetical protein
MTKIWFSSLYHHLSTVKIREQHSFPWGGQEVKMQGLQFQYSRLAIYFAISANYWNFLKLGIWFPWSYKRNLLLI